MKALFLTKHPPTDEALQEVANRFGPINVEIWNDFENRQLLNDDQVTDLLQELANCIGETASHEVALFGNFPTPLLEQMTKEPDLEMFPQGTRFIRCYTAWTNQSYPEDTHKRWCRLGKLPVPPTDALVCT